MDRFAAIWPPAQAGSSRNGETTAEQLVDDFDLAAMIPGFTAPPRYANGTVDKVSLASPERNARHRHSMVDGPIRIGSEIHLREL
jgi:radical SAM superfamily enzyme with C-terminal helix-hairpin-helix motif